jgi:hypothetical protein
MIARLPLRSCLGYSVYAILWRLVKLGHMQAEFTDIPPTRLLSVKNEWALRSTLFDTIQHCPELDELKADFMAGVRPHQ